jgi:hypothetical protein
VGLHPSVIRPSKQHNLPTSINQSLRQCYISLHRPPQQQLLAKDIARSTRNERDAAWRFAAASQRIWYTIWSQRHSALLLITVQAPKKEAKIFVCNGDVRQAERWPSTDGREPAFSVLESVAPTSESDDRSIGLHKVISAECDLRPQHRDVLCPFQGAAIEYRSIIYRYQCDPRVALKQWLNCSTAYPMNIKSLFVKRSHGRYGHDHVPALTKISRRGLFSCSPCSPKRDCLATTGNSS